MDNCMIRYALPEDYLQVETIMQQVQNLHVGWRPDIYKPCSPVMTQEHFDDLLAKQALLVAVYEGRIVGALAYMERHVSSPTQVSRQVIFIDMMAVDEKYRHQGVGRQLFDHLKEIARDGHYDGIELQVNARNTDAYAMYRHYGFTEKSINLELL